MKEIDYKKKYEQALERAKGAHNSAKSDKENGVTDKITEYTIQLTETIFPELKESEDERVKKGLIDFLKSPFINENITDEKVAPWIAWLEKQGEPIDKGEISDGYHTFNELYYYRLLYNAAFFNMLPKEWVHKSKKHNDGEECFGGGWFIVMANLPTGQISNHYELKYWDLFSIPEKEFADKWDGHTPQEAAERLHRYLLEKQGEQKYSNKLKPKFKVGDSIKTANEEPPTITKITDNGYWSEDLFICSFRDSDKWKLAEQKLTWNEEDERLQQCLIEDQEKCLEEVENNKVGHSEIISDLKEMYRERIDWLKSLKERAI